MSKRRYIRDRDCDDKDEGHSKTMRMCDLNSELDMIILPKRMHISERPAHHVSLFDSLPDELVLKVMKMYAKGSSLYTDPVATYSGVMNPIARVSSRFRRIATDRSLWSGHVKLQFQDPKHLWPYVIVKSEDYSDIRFQDVVDYAIKYCLHDRVRVLHLVDEEHSLTELTQDQLRTIAQLCPRLETLVLCFVRVESILGWKMEEVSQCHYCQDDDYHISRQLSIR